MTSDERVSGPISGESQSTDSVGEILRTDGRTHEEVSYPPLTSESSVTRAHVRLDRQLGTDWRRFAPASREPTSMQDNLDAWICDYDASLERLPVIRTGTREPICWHVRSMIKQRDGYRCRWCGTEHRELHIDHIKPWSAGGTHDSRNLQVLCDRCNETKSNRADLRLNAPAVVVECVRCREPGGPTTGDPVWCFTCRGPSQDRTPWADLAQRYLANHCEEILRPKQWNRDVAMYERLQLVWSWQEWAPNARNEYEAELRTNLRDLILEHRAQTRGLPAGDTQ